MIKKTAFMKKIIKLNQYSANTSSNHERACKCLN